MQAEAQDPRDYFDAGSLILALAAALSWLRAAPGLERWPAALNKEPELNAVGPLHVWARLAKAWAAWLTR